MVSTRYANWFELAGIGLLGLYQWWQAKKSERANVQAERGREIATASVTIGQSVVHAELMEIKALVNGEKLELYRQRADALTLIAAYRNAPGDNEAADLASRQYNQLKVTQAVIMEHALQAEIDRRELSK